MRWFSRLQWNILFIESIRLWLIDLFDIRFTHNAGWWKMSWVQYKFWIPSFLSLYGKSWLDIFNNYFYNCIPIAYPPPPKKKPCYIYIYIFKKELKWQLLRMSMFYSNMILLLLIWESKYYISARFNLKNM